MSMLLLCVLSSVRMLLLLTMLALLRLPMILKSNLLMVFMLSSLRIAFVLAFVVLLLRSRVRFLEQLLAPAAEKHVKSRVWASSATMTEQWLCPLCPQKTW